jgi:hypothetical protein
MIMNQVIEPKPADGTAKRLGQNPQPMSMADNSLKSRFKRPFAPLPAAGAQGIILPEKSGVAWLPCGFALGNILMVNGQITRDQLDEALCHQLATGRRLGEELISAGYAGIGQVEGSLVVQRKLVAYALAFAVGVSPLADGCISPAQAGQMSAALPVSVRVIAHAEMQTIFQATHIGISPSDVARGYLDVASASRFSVSTNSRSGYLVEFYPVGHLFKSVQVNGLGDAVQLGADGGQIVQRATQATHPNHELSFRFTLHPNTLAGRYPWPLLLSVRALP